MERLREGLEGLLAHMSGAEYSEGYVREAGSVARRLVEAAPSLPDWDRATEWALDPEEGIGPRAGGLVAICRAYDEAGALPRTGEPAPRRAPLRARDTLCAGLARVLEAYEASEAAALKRESSVRCEVSCAASFLARLEALGVTDVADATEDQVIGLLTDDGGAPAYSPSLARHLRAVLTGASAEVEGCARLAALVPVPRAWRKTQPVLAPEESEAVSEALLDDGSGLRLRDRAIVWLLMLAAMRASDVAGMRMDSIDWARDLIVVTQRKTGAPLEVPLPTRAGNAIIDYASRERRRDTGSELLFLSSRWPYAPLTADGVRGVCRHVLDVAGVRVGERAGSHVFRRTAITAMVGAGEDRAVVAAIAGHRSPETTDSYMVASVEGLRRHASPDVSRFAPKGGDA